MNKATRRTVIAGNWKMNKTPCEAKELIGKIAPLVEEKSDVLISMADRHDFPVDFIIRCTKARFKIGRHKYEGHPFDMVLKGGETADLRSDARQIFAAITEFLTKIK